MRLKVPWRRNDPKETYDLLAALIVLATLKAGAEGLSGDAKQQTDACAELLYFFLFALDRQAFKDLGPVRRDALIDEVANRAFARFTRTVLREDAPPELLARQAAEMFDTYNARVVRYAGLRTLIGKEPGSGTDSAVFALSQFMQQAQGKAAQTIEDRIALQVMVLEALVALKLPEHIKRLQ